MSIVPFPICTSILSTLENNTKVYRTYTRPYYCGYAIQITFSDLSFLMPTQITSRVVNSLEGFTNHRSVSRPKDAQIVNIISKHRKGAARSSIFPSIGCTWHQHWHTSRTKSSRTPNRTRKHATISCSIVRYSQKMIYLQ